MLENQILKIKASKTKRRIQLYFIFITVGLVSLMAVFLPELIRLLDEEMAGAGIFSYASAAFLKRGIPAFVVSLIFALYGSKKFSSNTMVQLIRFFLITFMLLVGLTFIASR